jgi:hypothetical protein
MKKNILGILVGATLTLSMVSCGESLLKEEQVQAEILKGVEAGKPAIQQEEEAICESTFEDRVNAEVENMKAAAEAAKAAGSSK